MNTLKSYLDDTGETQRQFARRINVREATVSGWCGGTLPRPVHMARIEEATDGLVPISAWFSAITGTNTTRGETQRESSVKEQ